MLRILAASAILASLFVAQPVKSGLEPILTEGMSRELCLGITMGPRMMPGDGEAMTRCAAQYVRARIDGDSDRSWWTANMLRREIAVRADLAHRRLNEAGCSEIAGRVQLTSNVLIHMTRYDVAVNAMGPWWSSMNNHLATLADGDACMAAQRDGRG